MRLFKDIGQDVKDIYTFATLVLMPPILMGIAYLILFSLASCKGWEVRFQGDLNEERWEAREQER